jgi:hypothetical protein
LEKTVCNGFHKKLLASVFSNGFHKMILRILKIRCVRRSNEARRSDEVGLPLKKCIEESLSCAIQNLNLTKHLKTNAPFILIPWKVITFNLQVIPFKVFKKWVLTWERTDSQVLKKVITLCENIKSSHWKSENRSTLVYTLVRAVFTTYLIITCFWVVNK